jgi:hypothetical protein
MTKRFIAGGCSFTVGHELSDYDKKKQPSKKTWAYGLFEELSEYLELVNPRYVNVARAGSGNSGIARRVFDALNDEKNDEKIVMVMWSFLSRYDWAMPKHKFLEDTRWATITPWDANYGRAEAFRTLANAEPEQEGWKARRKEMKQTNVSSFADAIYKYGANQYHEIYLSWKSIIWLQNILEKKKIPFMFTLADNTLFYDEMILHSEKNSFLKALYNEIDFTKWVSFGERMMGFNQWALIKDYERGITHPLDKAHQDAVQLLKNKARKILGVNNV